MFAATRIGIRSVKRSPLAFVASAFAGNAQSALSVTLPSMLPGDFVLLFVSMGSTDTFGFAATPATPTGYTFIAGTTQSFTKMRAFYKFMGPTPDTSVSITNSSSNDASAIALVFRGVNTTTPVDVTSVVVNGSTDPGAITPVTAGAIVIAAASVSDGFSSSMLTSGPTGYSNLVGTTAHAFLGEFWARMATATKTWTSGSENPSVFTPAGGGTSNSALTIALRPA